MHPKFKREGDNIIYLHQMSLIDSLKSLPVEFTTIDNEVIKVSLDEVISPLSEKTIVGKGMPIFNNDPLGPIKKNFARGNMIIRFDI